MWYTNMYSNIKVYQKYLVTFIKVGCATHSLYASSGPKAKFSNFLSTNVDVIYYSLQNVSGTHHTIINFIQVLPRMLTLIKISVKV